MIKRRGCLYNGNYVGIENFYSIIEGKKINADNGILEKYRILGEKNELFCPCGCGANLVIVAGQNQIRSQHFRIKRRTKKECCYEEENIISVYSNVIINCWLKDKLQLSHDDIACRVKISNISDSDRKYELSTFIQKRNFGIVYVRNYHNIDDEKIKVLTDIINSIKTLYICDIGRENDIEAKMGQYPEFFNKIQNIQGYCVFLNLRNIDNQSEMYKETEMIVKYNLKDEIGLWKKLEVAKGSLSEFSIDDNNNLIYNNTSVLELVEKARSNYYEEIEKLKERERARIRQKELERLIEEKKQENNNTLGEETEQEDKRQSILIMQEKNRIIKQETEEEKKWNEEYDLKYKKSVALFEFIKTLEWIEGSFHSRQDFSYDKEYKRRAIINSVKFDRKHNRIEIKDIAGEQYLIYIKENGYKTNGCAIGTFYRIVDLEDVCETEIVQYFKGCFLCMSKDENKNLDMICTLENTNCPHAEKSTKKCTFTNSKCSFRKHI